MRRNTQTGGSLYLSSSFLDGLEELRALWVTYVPISVTSFWAGAALCSSSGLESPDSFLISFSTMGIWTHRGGAGGGRGPVSGQGSLATPSEGGQGVGGGGRGGEGGEVGRSGGGGGRGEPQRRRPNPYSPPAHFPHNALFFCLLAAQFTLKY